MKKINEQKTYAELKAEAPKNLNLYYRKDGDKIGGGIGVYAQRKSVWAAMTMPWTIENYENTINLLKTNAPVFESI